MKKLLFSFLIFIASINSLGQNVKIDSLKNIINLYNQKKNHKHSEDTLATLAYIDIAKFYRTIKSDSTLYFSNKGKEIAIKSNWLPGQALSMIEAGLYFYYVNIDYGISLSHFLSAQKTWDLYLPKVPEPFVSYQLNLWPGLCYEKLGQLDSALVYYSRAVEVTKKFNLENESIVSLNTIGLYYQKLNYQTEAIKCFDEGLKISLTRNDSAKIASLYGNIGKSYFYLSNYSEALRNIQLAYDIDKGLNNIQGQIRHLLNISDVYQRQGEYEKALEIQNQISESYTTYNYGYGICMSLNSKAQIYLMIGEFEKATLNGLAALQWGMEINNSFMTSSCLTTLGVIAQFKGDYPAAIDYFNQSHEIDVSEGRENQFSVYLGNVANVYSQLGLYEKALSIHEEVLEYAQSNNDKYLEVTTLGNIGGLFVRLKKFDEALKYNNLALKIAEDNNFQAIEATSLISIAQIFYIQNDYASSERYYRKSLVVSELIDAKVSISSCYASLCAIEVQNGNYEAAITLGMEGLNYAMLTKSPANLTNALVAIYHAYIKSNNPDIALLRLSELRQLISDGLETNFYSLSEKERESYFATVESNLDSYYDFGLFYQKEYTNITDTLYNLALTTKGLSLKSSTFLRQSILASEDSSLIADYNQLIKLRKEIASSTNEIETKQEEELANTLEKNIVKRSGAFSDFEKIKSIDWKQIQRTLKPDECAIEFVNFESYIDTAERKIYAALLVKQDSKHPEFIQLCSEAELTEIIGVFQGNNLEFVNAVYGTKEKAQTSLYDKIWKPLEPSLKKIKTVFYSPSGLLHKVSMASLCKSQNVFLADLYNLRQMGSTTSLSMNSDIRFGSLENFLLMGGVNFNSSSTQKEIWNYLPGSLNETDAINAMLQKKKFGVQYFIGNNASEEKFKEKISSSSIVHIATHGFFFPDPEQVREEIYAESENNTDLKFRGDVLNIDNRSTNYANWNFVNNQNPLMRSGLVLSGANNVWSRETKETGEDGILTAAEVSNLDLRNAKLVVLSACETGLGDIKGSEGVFGLQRAFKMAGVKYIIMSLWQVPDEETSEFMILFYKNLIKVKDIPMAFQKTQKVMREKYDPYFWAAFVLIE